MLRGGSIQNKVPVKMQAKLELACRMQVKSDFRDKSTEKPMCKIGVKNEVQFVSRISNLVQICGKSDNLLHFAVIFAV